MDLTGLDQILLMHNNYNNNDILPYSTFNTKTAHGLFEKDLVEKVDDINIDMANKKCKTKLEKVATCSLFNITYLQTKQRYKKIFKKHITLVDL